MPHSDIYFSKEKVQMVAPWPQGLCVSNKHTMPVFPLLTLFIPPHATTNLTGSYPPIFIPLLPSHHLRFPMCLHWHSQYQEREWHLLGGAISSSFVLPNNGMPLKWVTSCRSNCLPGTGTPSPRCLKTTYKNEPQEWRMLNGSPWSCPWAFWSPGAHRKVYKINWGGIEHDSLLEQQGASRWKYTFAFKCY